MTLLAIDTSIQACSVAVLSANDAAPVELFEIAPQQHNQLLLTQLETCLAKAGIGVSDLAVIAFGAGPGSFTGVRIATCVAQAIALSHDLPMVAVSTLEAIAYRAFQTHGVTRVIPTLDARLGQIYWGAYEFSQTTSTIIIPDQVTAPEQLQPPTGAPWAILGQGWQAYQSVLEQSTFQVVEGEYPHAADIAKLGYRAFEAGLVTPAEKAQPNYVRDKVAEKQH